MVSAVLAAALLAAGQGCPAGGCGGIGRNVHGLAMGVFHGAPVGGFGCCGAIAPHLLGGTPGPAVTPPEEQMWNDYLAELDFDDREAMKGLWGRADFDGRKKLLGMLAQLRADQAKEKADEEDKKPLSDADQARWDEHLKKLKGDEKTKAEDAWKAGNLKARRALLRALPPK